MGITSIKRDYGVSPSLVRITTTDTLATANAAGYLTTQKTNIESLNEGPFDWAVTDLALVYARDGAQICGLSIDFTGFTDVGIGPGGSSPYLLKSGGAMTGPIQDLVYAMNYSSIAAPTALTPAGVDGLGPTNILFEFTAATSLTAPAVSAYEDGIIFAMKNTSVGNATFVPNGTDKIDGVNATLTLAPQTGVWMTKTAGQWSTLATFILGGGASALPTYSRQVPVNGFSITIGAGIQNLVLVPAGQLATGTVIMPAAPVDKQIVSVSAEAAGVTSLAVNANAGQTIGNAPTTIAAGQGFSYQYNLANTNWMPIYQPSAASGVTAAQVQNWSVNSGSSGGAANAYTLTLTPPSAALVDSLTVIMIPNNDNTSGSPTLNLDGHGAKTITRWGSQALANLDIQAGYPCVLTYLASVDNWILQTPSNINMFPTALQVQSNTFNGAITSGGTVAFTATLNPVLGAYVDRMPVILRFNADNSTSTPTIDLGPGVRNIVKRGQAALAVNDIVAGTDAFLIYSSVNANFELQNPQTKTQPTIQVFNSGSGTYTKPAGCTRIVVKETGGSGAGEGSGTSLTGTAGGNGADTTFGTATATGGKGGGGVTLGVGGLGGGASGSSTSALNGGNGGGGGVSLLNIGGGMGGAAGGGYGAPTPYIGGNAQPGTNGNSYGAGGSGAGGSATLLSGAGGGGGGYNEWWVNNPAATYSYSVGAGGTAGAAGTAGQIGGAGAIGLIEVEEYYN